MVDMVTISAAFTGLTFAREAFQFVLRTKVEVDTRTRVAEAVEKLTNPNPKITQAASAC